MAKINTDIAEAVRILKNNHLVAIPTETVYGLAGNGFSDEAILRIFEVKNRPRFNPLILHISKLSQLEVLTNNIPKEAEQLIQKFWPGALTILVPKTDIVPDLVTAGNPKVAVRMPSHPLTLELLNQLDFPLAAPSANPYNYVSPSTAAHVQTQLGDRIDLILDGGPCNLGVESTIIDFDTDGNVILLREGAIAREEIEEVIGKPLIVKTKSSSNSSEAALAPGMSEKHYSPSKKLLLFNQLPNLETIAQRFSLEDIAILRFNKSVEGFDKNKQYILSSQGSLKEAAAKLFATLRHLDEDSSIKVIIAEEFPELGVGRAINDRLRRASL